MSKIQGEGDYEAARRFNRRSSKQARHHAEQPALLTHPATADEIASEQKGLARSRGGKQDRRDAEVFEKEVRDAGTFKEST